MLSNVAIVVLVGSLVSHLAGFPQLPGGIAEQTAAQMPIHTLAAAVILLLVTSISGPQPR